MRFAVLHHTLPETNIRPSHWDLLLQFADYQSHEEKCLDCFELHLPPDHWSLLEASQLPSHRAFFLNYSGPISGNRGSVQLVLAGEVQWHVRDASNLDFELTVDPIYNVGVWEANGQRFQLTRQEEDHWTLQLQPPGSKTQKRSRHSP
jgi:hypothetical protein